MIKRFFTSAFVALCLCVTIGCEDDDKVSSVPVYDNMVVADDVYTGQKVKATVYLADAGAYVLHADNSYTLTKGGKTWAQGTWRVVDPKNVNPEFQFNAPYEQGRYSLNFKSKFSFYVDLPNGGIYGQSNSVSSTVDVKLADAIDACWGDSRDRLSNVLEVKDTLANASHCKVWTGKQAFYDIESSQLDSLGGNSERIYAFDAEGGLCKVYEKTTFALSYKSSYKEFDDGESGYVNDSIANMYVYPHLIGVGNMLYYVLADDAKLEGDLASEYPVADWGKYNSDQEKAKLINAFWNGSLTSYEQKWILYNNDGVLVTKCTVRTYVENDEFVITRLFEKVE